MEEYCKVCGLPKDLCVCSGINVEDSIIEVYIEKRRFGKKYSIIKGLSGKKEDLKPLLKKLKSKLGCGGTLTGNNTIELQGDHLEDIKKILISEGNIPEELIHLKYGKKK